MKSTLLLILANAVILVSCKKDPDNQNLFGKWDLYKRIIYVYDLKKEILLDSITDVQYGFPVMLELKANYACSLYCYSYAQQKHNLIKNGAYNVESKQLNFKYDERRTIDIINERELSIYYDYPKTYKKGTDYINALYSDIEYYNKQ